MFVSGCTENSEEINEQNSEIDSKQAPEQQTVIVGVGPWGTAYSSSYVIKQVLEEAGYNVELDFVDIGVAYQGVVLGDLDCYTDAWVPTCHEKYMEKYGNQLETLGSNMNGTRIGMIVPAYVPIDSIDELNDHTEEFDGKIISIEPGSGTVRMSEQAIVDYELEGYELVTGSEIGMLSELKSAIENEEWIVITGWTPHWKFSRWDLKYLDDPKKVYGDEEYIGTIVRKGFKEDNPGAYAILDRFNWEAEDMNWVMYEVEKGASDEEAAAMWIENNPDKVAEWLGEE